MSVAIETITELDVTKAQSRDAAAFTRLVDASKSAVASIAFAIVKDPHASEELAQDVYLEAWDGLHQLRNPASFLPWLRQMTRNRAHEFVRSRVRYRKRHAPFTSDAIEVADEVAIASKRLIDAETHAALADALEQLPDDTREIVTLFYREGESIRHVAELLGLSEAAVKKRLERARTTLRGTLLERFADAAKKTAPGATFTAGVAAAIAVASPSTASAATGAAAKLIGVSKGLGLLAPIFGAVGGPALGLAGIVFGMRKNLSTAIDDRERHELEALRLRACLAIIATAILMTGAGYLASISRLLTAFFYVTTLATFQVALFSMLMVQLPKILSRRPNGDPDIKGRLPWMIAGTICSWIGMGLGVYFLLR